VTEEQDGPLSPTVTKVLDAYFNALKGDSAIDDDAAGRLNDLLRQAKVPKIVDIDVALFPTDDGKAAS